MSALLLCLSDVSAGIDLSFRCYGTGRSGETARCSSVVGSITERAAAGSVYVPASATQSGSGTSEFQISTEMSHWPSGCFRQISTYLPISWIGSGVPSTM